MSAFGVVYRSLSGTPLVRFLLAFRFYLSGMRRCLATIVVGLAIGSVAGCGASDRDRVAQRVEGYAHSLAAHDARAACAAFTAQRRRLEPPGCGVPQRTSPSAARTFALLIADARAARIFIHGDRASAFLRVGRCVLRKTLTNLVRDKSGTWRIDAFGIVIGTAAPVADCVNQ